MAQSSHYHSFSQRTSAKLLCATAARTKKRTGCLMFDGHAEPLSYQQLTEERAKYCNPCVKQWRDSNLAIREF